jgi:hypothetical protein
MSQKQTKKTRQEVRRAVKKQIGEGMEAVAIAMYDRPRFIPKWIWIGVYVPAFKWRYLGVIYKHMK